MSVDERAREPNDADRAKPVILPAAEAFDGRDHVMSSAAWELQLRATAISAVRDHPGSYPTSTWPAWPAKTWAALGTEPVTLAAELCTAGMWERADGGYRVLDTGAVQLCIDHVRELRDRDNRGRRVRAATVIPGPGGTTGEVAAAGMPRFGERIGQRAAASFRCAACGEVAGVVKVARAGTTVDMGPPLGEQAYDRDAIVVDYFVGTASKFADAATLDAVQEIVSSQAPDPVALRHIDWELAPFYCPGCDLNYCRADWHSFPIFDEGFYDCTIGICPGGHRHTVDD
jgi:hypothetical protein